tara:strand:+ start:6909 stop:7391 length:483 start_codon:yes stop_codon:yes gene_type:complete
MEELSKNKNKPKTIDINKLLKIKKSVTYNSVILHIQASEFVKLDDYDYLISQIDDFIGNAKEVNMRRYNKERFIVYTDLSKTYIKNMDIKFFKQCVPIFQDKYPESLEKLILVNMPVFFKACFQLVKFLIDKDTRKKIFFEKKNKNKNNLYTNNLDEIDL